MRIGKFLVIHVPRSLHPWVFGFRSSRLYLGPILIYKRRKR